MKRNESPVFEICWNGNPNDVTLIYPDDLPDPSCASCKHHCKDKETDECCDGYEWDEETFREEREWR